jgi:hypothetical protein
VVPVKVTVLPVPTCLVAKVPVVPEAVTVSPATRPLKLAPLCATVAAVVPS